MLFSNITYQKLEKSFFERAKNFWLPNETNELRPFVTELIQKVKNVTVVEQTMDDVSY